MAADTKPVGGLAVGECPQPTPAKEAGPAWNGGRDVPSALLADLPESPTGAGVLLTDLGGMVCFCSESVARLAGTTASALTGKPIADVVPELPLRVQTPGYNLVFAAFRRGDDQGRGVRLLRVDGSVVSVEASLSTVALQRERLVVVQLSWRPVENESFQALSRLAWVGERSAECVMVTDGDGVIEYVNPVFESVTGYASGEVVGRTPAILKSDAHDGEFFRALWHTIRAGRPFHAVFVNRDKHGRLFHEDKSICPVVDSRGRVVHFLSTGRDVSDAVRSMERLEYRASHDLLTDLPGRTLFLDRLEHSVASSARRGQGFTVAYLDVDRFKEINDSLGHAAGDTVLQEVARRLRKCVRAEDTVARLSGDEFAVVLAGVDRVDAARGVLRKIVAAFRPAVRIAERIVPVTVSIGACLYPVDSKDGQALLRCADGAMYQAKSTGGNCWRFFNAEEVATRTGARSRGRVSNNGRAPTDRAA
jgi:diguanylate cyclase (GGDEF)-like protein/PAS domain S-box-containing protein